MSEEFWGFSEKQFRWWQGENAKYVKFQDFSIFTLELQRVFSFVKRKQFLYVIHCITCYELCDIMTLVEIQINAPLQKLYDLAIL